MLSIKDRSIYGSKKPMPPSQVEKYLTKNRSIDTPWETILFRMGG